MQHKLNQAVYLLKEIRSNFYEKPMDLAADSHPFPDRTMPANGIGVRISLLNEIDEFLGKIEGKENERDTN